MLSIGRVDADDAESGLGIRSDNPSRIDATIVQCYFEFARAVYDVAVGQDKPVARDQEPGAAARPAHTIEVTNINDAGRNPIDHRRDRPGIRIEQLIVA